MMISSLSNVKENFEMFSKVPKHWVVKKLGYLTSLKSGETITADTIEDQGMYPVYGGNGLRGYTDSFTHIGDYILIGRQGALCGNINYAHGNFWASEHAVVATPLEEYDYRWLGESLRAMNLNQYSVSAAQPGIAIDRINALKIGVPPLQEQRLIADYLDRETTQIDNLIAAKEQMLTLLEEKREALISHAVTRGLDPDVAFKRSGLDWLGDIPQHWQVLKIKYITKIVRGQFSHRPRNDPKLYGGRYPFIQTGDVANANKFILGYTQTLNEDGYGVSKEFPSGTLVMTIAANIGDMAILNFNACFPDSVVGFVPSNKTEILFLYYLFRSMRNQFLSTAVLNTQLNLNVERISNLVTVIPPVSEQTQITDYLDQEISKMDELLAALTDSIALLKERRSALITAAVTGQIALEEMTP